MKPIFKKMLLIPLGALILASMIYLVFFCDLFFFNPIRNKPDELIVYHYGEQTVYTKETQEFQQLYHAFRSQSGTTVLDMLSRGIVQASYRGTYDIYEHMEKHLAVKFVYHQTQKGFLQGSYNEEYCEIIYPLGDYFIADPSTTGNSKEHYSPYYVDPQGDSQYVFYNYPFPEKANDWLMTKFDKPIL